MFEGFLKIHEKWEYTGAPAFSRTRQLRHARRVVRSQRDARQGRHRGAGRGVRPRVSQPRRLREHARGRRQHHVGRALLFPDVLRAGHAVHDALAETEAGTLHGRNLDIGLEVHNITGQITFRKTERILFTASQFIGYNGVHTGMRLRNAAGEGWSVQANERPSLVPGPFVGYRAASALMTVASFALGAKPVGSYLRAALTEHATYDDALPFLKSEYLASPMYVIVAGAENGQGGCITRDRKGVSRSNQFGFPIESKFRGVHGPAFEFQPIAGQKHDHQAGQCSSPTFRRIGTGGLQRPTPTAPRGWQRCLFSGKPSYVTRCLE